MDWNTRISKFAGCWSGYTPLTELEKMLMEPMREPVLVDMDGTLMDGAIDKQFNYFLDKYDRIIAESWYAKQDLSVQRVNWLLVEKLVILKQQGHKLYVWTNRNEGKLGQTKACLLNNGIYELFDGFIFCGGEKIKSVSSGLTKDAVIFDNEAQYGTNCVKFNHIPTFM